MLNITTMKPINLNTSRPNTNTPHFTKGFTLIELIITITIAAILLSIAVPSFTNLIRSNQITAYTNELSTTVNLARSEAIKRGTSIIVTSSGGTDWSQGWNLATTAGDVLRVTQALTGDNTFTGNVSTVTFNSRGALSGAQASWSICHSEATTGRSISIAVTGRISVTELSTCP